MAEKYTTIKPTECTASANLTITYGSAGNAYDSNSSSYATWQHTSSGFSGQGLVFSGLAFPDIPDGASSLLVYASVRYWFTPDINGNRYMQVSDGLQLRYGTQKLASAELTSGSTNSGSVQYYPETVDQYRQYRDDIRIYVKVEPYSSGYKGAITIYEINAGLRYESPINKVIVNKNGTPETLIDLTSDTVTADRLLSGYTAHDATGAIITGTYTPSIPSNYGLITYDGGILTVS